MTEVYDPPKKYKGDKLTPFPHVEKDDGDALGYIRAVSQRARERQVSYETVRLLRQKVILCFRENGVNHHELCREVAEEYKAVIQKKDLGQLQPKWKNPEQGDGW